MARVQMQRTLRWVLVLTALLLPTGDVAAVDGVDIAGSVSLTIDSATIVGGGLAADSGSTTYSVVNTLGTKKIVGRINTLMPNHTTLAVALAAPSGASSAGSVTLTSTDQNLVTGINVVTESGLDMTFALSATVNAGIITSGNRTVTLTLVDAP